MLRQWTDLRSQCPALSNSEAISAEQLEVLERIWRRICSRRHPYDRDQYRDEALFVMELLIRQIGKLGEIEDALKHPSESSTALPRPRGITRVT